MLQRELSCSAAFEATTPSAGAPERGDLEPLSDWSSGEISNLSPIGREAPYRQARSSASSVALQPPRRQHLPPTTTTWQQRHGNNVATTWQRRGNNVATTWQQRGNDVATTWQQRGNDVATTCSPANVHHNNGLHNNVLQTSLRGVPQVHAWPTCLC
jgi:hypothetical protein